jgi:hypothetical protein
MVAISIIGVRMTRPKSIEVCGASAAVPPRDQRDVEGGAAHVAGDDVLEARRSRRCSRRDHPRRGARQRGAHRQAAGGVDAITPPFDCTIRNSPAEAARLQRRFEPVEVARDLGLQIGVERGGREALELADLGQDLVEAVTWGLGQSARSASTAARSLAGLA